MGRAKIIFGDQVLQDLTNDTVTPEVLMEGYTAHAANGETIVGTASGGTDDYEQLTNKPQINNVTLIGNKSFSDLGAISEDEAREYELIDGKNKLLNEGLSTSTTEGATFTKNSDLSVTVNRSTATSNAAYYNITAGTTGEVEETRESGTYIISGVPSGSTGLTLQYYDVTANQSWNDSGSGAEITVVNGHTVKVTIRVAPNQTLSDITVSPMICTLVDWNKSHDYVPYQSALKDTLRDAEVINSKNYWDQSIQYPYGNNNNGISLSQTKDGFEVHCGTAKFSGYFIPRSYLRKLYGNIPGPLIISYECKCSIDNCPLMIGINNYEYGSTTWKKYYKKISDPASIDNFVMYNNDRTGEKEPIIYMRNIMLCTEEDWNKSHAYSPYYVPVKDSKLDIADQQVLGAWNELNNKATTSTISPATFKVNADKSVSVAISSTPSGNVIFNLDNNATIKAGTRYLSGCPDIDSDDVFIQIYKSGVIDVKNKRGTELEFTVASDITGATIRIVIGSGVSADKVDGKVFKPMISLEPNQPYVPYAMTNRELTDRVEFVDITSEIEVNTTQTAYEVTSSSLHAYRFGKLINVYFQIKSLTENAMPAGRTFITLFSNLPTPISEIMQNVNPSGAGNICQVFVPTHMSSPHYQIHVRGGTVDAFYNVNLFYFAK